MFFWSTGLFAQNKMFLYDYKFIPDSTNRARIENRIMALNIDQNKSEFYEVARFQSDSTLAADSKKGLFSMPPNKNMIDERIVKSKNSTKIDFIKALGLDSKYFVTQDVILNWKLLPEFGNVLGYKVQKAIVDFGGRSWEAWFSSEIPISDGPYKFFGLPGLILKIQDKNANHVFELQAIRDYKANFVYPMVNNFNRVNCTYSQFVSAYKTYRKNPAANLVGRIPDQKDINGVFHSGAELIREIEKEMLATIAKDNNIIELDLLK